MFNPLSTYRIQFHKEFSFKDFAAIIPYLQQLGISTVYASPIFEAVPGSVHGYDCTNPLRINPEIGTLEELQDISKTLKAAGISWIQDIVPNHMAFHPNNEWLMDVLAQGEASEYAPVFDIIWNSRGNEKLMVPFLGNPLQQVIEDGQLKLVSVEGKTYFDYFDSRYPLSKESIADILKDRSADEALNDKALLLQLANAQHYRLCHWQETDTKINYRRFFTVNGLICLNIQDENVFHLHHGFVKHLLEEGIFQGLRIDHIDGLQNPTEYLHRLRKLAGPDTYIVAEKILEPGEQLPDYWPMQGTSGYDFLATVNNVFTNRAAEPGLTTFYQNLTGNYDSIHQQLRDKKAHILYEHMNGELDNLYRLFMQLNLIEKRRLSVIPTDDFKSALGEFLIQCPVYRFYGEKFPLSAEEQNALRNILYRLKRSGESVPAVNILEDVFLNKPGENNEEANHRIAQFYKRCMQFTGPLMAKGVEDTLMYTYNRFIGHNEVGDSPEAFGIAPDELHKEMQWRQQRWPLSMNGTSTHDTKRGEDARTRLNVLTDIEETWLNKVEEWRELNRELIASNGLDANDEYLIYQAMVAHYHPAEEAQFAERIQQFIEKALREAKTHSNWTTPKEEYESAAKSFAVALLDKSKPFWKSFEGFLQSIAEHSIINSLSQVLLKFSLPGVPDTYQGCEGWDFSFVDPDNRRAVDYNKRQNDLQSFDGKRGLLRQLWQSKEDGKIKLWLTHQLLTLRKSESSLFADGDYLSLQTTGKYKEYVFAFARRQSDRIYAFVIPLHTAKLCQQQGTDFFNLDWADTAVVLPQHNGVFEHLLQKGEGDKLKNLEVKNLFKRFPLAALKGKQVSKERGAGILLHITSLSSPYGIGDLGAGAKAFADFLHRSGQKYWQLLPLNPTEAGQGYSPYSALSSKAGWPLLLSLDDLVKQGVLSADDAKAAQLAAESFLDYKKVEETKLATLSMAFDAFSKDASSSLQQEFALFIEKERSWLDDFALFQFLKSHHNDQPWFQWPDELKHRDEDALERIAEEDEVEIQRIKWYQFIFNQQWQDLKTYCHNRNIKLIGDMPFYVSYDSADVWAAQHLFSLDEDGAQTGIAGVPPDAFSADGQLWGMPTFNWQKMEEEGYVWWIQRLRKNIELFDLTRLDHFRAFAAYWQVPAGEKTAKGGQWIEGPGSKFFKAIQKEFGSLPFVAEDLGDINDDVLNLRDEFNLAGMKVLQFAFGADVSQSPYIPHNYERNFLVYTGTHDNNTTIGWWRTEADEEIRKRVANYTGAAVTEENAHEILMRLAYASVANIAIVPMQDVLGLDEGSRMNVPSSGENNWAWRLLPEQLNLGVERHLREWVQLYNR